MTSFQEVILKRFRGALIVAPLLFLLISCVNMEPTVDEYNLAKVALRAAEESEAKRYAPKSFGEASRYFKQGESAFKEKLFEKSAEYFQKSRYYSEKAENISRLKMFKQGDTVQ